MGRKKIQVKKIESRKMRRVTFSKRHKGLIKKAKELSIMCAVDVGLIVFSEDNDFIHFPDKESYERIVERYNTHPTKIKADLVKPPLELNAEEEVEKKGDEQEVERLRKKCDEQELIISQMDGKNLGNLSMEELNQIEKRMQNGFSRLREKQREHNKKIIAQLQEHSEKTIAELQHRIHLMEGNGQQKQQVLSLFPEDCSSRKRVARFSC